MKALVLTLSPIQLGFLLAAIQNEKSMFIQQFTINPDVEKMYAKVATTLGVPLDDAPTQKDIIEGFEDLIHQIHEQLKDVTKL